MHTVSPSEGEGINPLKYHLLFLEVGTEGRDFLAASPYSTSKCPAMGSSWELGPLVSQGSRGLQHSSCLHGAGLGVTPRLLTGPGDAANNYVCG